MSLNYDLHKTNGKVASDPTTETVIFMTMVVGMGEITETNAHEFADRVNFLQALQGPMMSQWDEATKSRIGIPITTDDIVAHIGLETNVAMETRLKFTKRITENWFNDQSYKRRQAKLDAQKAS